MKCVVLKLAFVRQQSDAIDKGYREVLWTVLTFCA